MTNRDRTLITRLRQSQANEQIHNFLLSIGWSNNLTKSKDSHEKKQQCIEKMVSNGINEGFVRSMKTFKKVS
jgi:hypothetical protein